MKQITKFFFISVLYATTLVARFHLIQRVQDFDRSLQKYDYSIACFASSQSVDFIKTTMTDSELQCNFDQIKNRMIAASRKDKFNDFLSKNIGFLMVDLTKSNNKKLLKDFGLIVTELPCMMLFDQDMVVSVMFKTPKSASEIVKMLNDQFGKNITKMVDDYWKSKMTDSQVQVPNYYSYGGISDTWYPYSVWPYSTWGCRSHGVGLGLELAEYT